MDPFKQLADSILNEDVQEEGILDRAKVRVNTLKSRADAAIRSATTSDLDKKSDYQGNFIREVLKSYDKIYDKKLQKLNKSSFEDIAILLKRQSKKTNSIQDWDNLNQILTDPRNLEILNNRIKEVYSNYILEAGAAAGIHPSPTPPPLPDQEKTVNQSTGDGDLSGTKADRAMSGP